MTEFQPGDASLRRLNAALTVVVCGTVVGVAYWYEQSFRRWSEHNHLLAVPQARIARTRASYRERRELPADLAQVIRQSGFPTP